MPTDGDRAVPVVLIDDDTMVAEPLLTVLGPELAAHGFVLLPLQAGVLSVPNTATSGVAVCDVVLARGPSGADAVRLLISRNWLVLLISGRAPDEQVLEAIRAGARGYVEKSSSTTDLIQAIDDVRAFGGHLSPALADLFYQDIGRRPLGSDELSDLDRGLLREIIQRGRPVRATSFPKRDEAQVRSAQERIFATARVRRDRPMHRLTPRELQVVTAVGCDRLSTAAVAGQLALTQNTVNTHLLNIKTKYLLSHPGTDSGISRRDAARTWAQELNLCAPARTPRSPDLPQGL